MWSYDSLGAKTGYLFKADTINRMELIYMLKDKCLRYIPVILAFALILLAVSPFVAFENQSVFSGSVHAAPAETKDILKASDSFRLEQWPYHHDKTGNSFDLQSYVQDGKIDLIIGFKDEYSFGLLGEVNRLQQRSAVQNLGGKIEHDFTIINALSARLPLQAVEALSQNSKVSFIEPNYQLTILSQQVPWGIDRVFGPEEYPFATWEYSIGQGIGVAVLDTGIDKKHDDLPTLLGGVNFIDHTDWGVDDHGHGTHVAGTIAALDNDLGVVGLSPAVELYAVKVMDESGKGSYACLINGIEWVDQNNIPIMNMSLGGKSYSQALKDAVDAAYDNGVLLVAAAGNEGEGTDNVLYPARFESVIAVSSADSNNDLLSTSSRGPGVELIAPGVNILSTLPGNKLSYASGTSMAAPHVVGSAALIWSADSNLSNEEVRNLLRQTAQDLGLPKDHQGYGLVRPGLAVAELFGIDNDESDNDSEKNLDPNMDARLADLRVCTGTLTPAFTPGKTDYSLVVDHDQEILEVTAVLSDPENAKMTINGQAQESGTARSIALEPAGQETLVTIKVTAEDEVTEKVYTISIERAEELNTDARLAGLSVCTGTLNPLFAPEETAYSLEVDYDVETLDVTAVLSDAENASMTINDQAQESGVAKAVNLSAAGTETAVNVVVTAEDGETTNIYTINVNRDEAPSGNADLSALAISPGTLAPAFNPDELSYDVNLDHDQGSVDITATLADENASLTINGEEATSGEAKAVSLGAAGTETAINVVVTAEDGETEKTYVIDLVSETTIISVEAVELSVEPADWQYTGEPVTFTAEVTEGNQDAEFRFYYRMPGDSWKSGTSYSTENTWTVNTSYVGEVQVGVIARAAGSEVFEEARYFIDYNIVARVEVVELTADPVERQLVGEPVTFTAEVTEGNQDAEFRFYYRKPGDSWKSGTSYSTENTWTVNTSYVGEVKIGVIARAVGTDVFEETRAIIDYAIEE